MAVPDQIGNYRVERLLGAGSFATVWLAHDPALDGRVAIKVLADNWTHDVRVRERFVEEGRLLWRLDDEHLVRVHAVGELPDGRPYLVMAWADGGSLRDRLDAGPLPADEAVAILRDVCAAVQVLHDREVVHRDLTPGNVLLRTRPDGRRQAVVADLGLAKALANASGLTARAGTPGYMAPEQDDTMAVVDTRTDVYALGRLARDVLSHGEAAPTPAVDAVLARATDADPAHRQADAAAFADELFTALNPPLPPPAAPPPPAVAAPVPTPGRRSRRLSSLITLLVLAGITVGLWRVARPTGAKRVHDKTGRLSLVLPGGWKGSGGGWKGPDGTVDPPEPALVVAPDPKAWTSSKTMPGVFVTVTTHGAATAEAQVAEATHEGCNRGATRTRQLGNYTWTIVRFRKCPNTEHDWLEAAATGPGGAVIWAQMTAVGNAPDEVADSLLASVRVKPA